MRTALAVGALMAGTGVALMAVAAHSAAPSLDGAAILLLVHGVALVAVASSLAQGLFDRRIGLVALVALGAGPILFAADIAARAVLGGRPFPMAAPAGGTIAIAAWAMLALAAALARTR